MKTLVLLSLSTAALISCSSSNTAPTEPTSSAPAKLYVAVEEAGLVTVLAGDSLAKVKDISFPDYMPHNVQVAPDGSTVWATLVAMEGMPDMQDQLAMIDPNTDEILARIDLGTEVHPAHVVAAPDGKTVFVSGATKNEVIRVDVASRSVRDRFPLGHGSGAHGLRLSPDGRSAWVAEIDGKCVARFDTATGTSTHTELEGQAVQVAVSADGRWVFASQYDTKKVARIDVASGAVTYVSLPSESQGPVQLYPAADGSLLAADQGVLAGRPASNKLYDVDPQGMTVRWSVDVGSGAHGVVVAGGRAYVTAIEDDTVTAVDVATHTVVGSVKIGRKPNGISAWSPNHGTP